MVSTYVGDAGIGKGCHGMVGPMRCSSPLSAVVVLTLVLAGCANSCDDAAERRKAQGFRVDLPAGTREVMTQAEALEIFALSPEPIAARDGGAEGSAFHGHRVLGSARVRDEDRTEAATLLLGDMANHKSTMVACNEPHHGFRFTRGNETVDLVMSFGCLHGMLFFGKGRSTVLISAESKSDIDTIYARYKLPSGK